uniref:Secreted protein n=1 Tax=Pristhesancus plagipennis TaxID=1955184 RepID=A0A2K8JSK0_PRIPG|nr:secreted hypothetical protein [Pristhesancus plagipennis]
MASHTSFLILLCIAAFSKADITQHALNFINELAEKSNDAKENLHTLGMSGKLTMENHRNSLKIQSQEDALMKVLKAKDLAERNNCPAEVHRQLDAVVMAVGNRWDECFNFTQAILNFTEYIVHAGSHYETVELLFCNGIQNVSLCSTGGFVDKWNCVTQSISNFITAIENSSGDFVVIVEDMNQYILQVMKTGMHCFGGIKQLTTNQVQEIMMKECKLTHNVVNLD